MCVWVCTHACTHALEATMHSTMLEGPKSSGPLSLLAVMVSGMWTKVYNTLSTLPHCTSVCHLSPHLVGPSISTIMVVVYTTAYCNMRYYGSLCYQAYRTGAGVPCVGVHLTPTQCLGGSHPGHVYGRGVGEVVQVFL